MTLIERQRTSWRLLVATLGLGLGLAVGGPDVSVAATSRAAPGPSVGPTGDGSSLATQSTVRRRGLWYAIGDKPTDAEVAAAPSRYGVVILNPWDVWALRRIKAVDPSVTVLMYKDLSSTRSYADAYALANPSGVGYAEAEAADPSWFAHDRAGQRIEWAPYPGHWQMAVWHPRYATRWARNVAREVAQHGWDGVFADNDFAHLGYYSQALLAGTSTSAETDAKIRAGLDGMVTAAGSEMSARGKLFVPNISEARLFPGRWGQHSRFGGAMEENFVHWGTDPQTGFLWDWAENGWLQQTSQMSAPGLSLAITRAGATDRRSQLYGYASVLVRGDASAFWSPSTTQRGDYTVPESMPEMSWALGNARTVGTRLPSGAWTRRYDGAFVVVNPSTSGSTADVPPGFVDAGARLISTVTVAGNSAVMLRRQ